MPSMQTLLLLLVVRGLIWRMKAKALAHVCLQVSMHHSLTTAEVIAVACEQGVYFSCSIYIAVQIFNRQV